MDAFSYELRAVRVVFRAGARREAGAELERRGLTRALIVCTPGRSADIESLRAALGSAAAGTFARAEGHVPASLVHAARAEVDRLRPDCLVTLGGGSAIGLGKALARDTALPLISIPTTYSGSEMTDIWGISEEGSKATGRDPRAAPAVVLYDPELTLSLPPRLSAQSGMNAAAHAVEALYAPDAHPVASLLAAEALRTLARALPRVVQAPHDIEARTDALRAAHFAGIALGQTSMGLHHKLCHVLGGSFHLPHAPTHAALLPHVVAYNAGAAGALDAVARALGVADAARGLDALNRRLGLTTALGDLGLRAEDVDRAAAAAAAAPPPNPRPVTREAVASILRAALVGSEPGAGDAGRRG